MALPALMGQAEAPRPTRVDLCLAFVIYDPDAPNGVGEFIGDVGGVWDRDEKRYVAPTGACETCRIVRVAKGKQLAATRHFFRWLEARRRGEKRDVVLFLGGKRRSGKGFLALAIAAAISLEVPGFPVFLVSGTEARRGELDRDLVEHPDKLHLPPDWFDYDVETATYHLANGSQIKHVSGAKPANIKMGGVSAILLNESQELKTRVAAFAIPAVADTGGLLILACNPPLPGSPGAWVRTWKRQIEAGKRQGTVFQLEPSDNPFIDRATLAAAAEFVEDIAPEVNLADVSGEWNDTVERAYPRWRDEYVVALPNIGLQDVTRQVTRRRCGYERDNIVGLDFQGKPHEAAVVWKAYAGVIAYRDERGALLEAVGTVDAPMFVAVEEMVLEQSDDEEFIDELAEAKLLKTSLFVGDPSGQWQGAKHDFRREAPSFKAFKAREALIYPPSPKRSDKGEYAGHVPVAYRLGIVMVLMRAGRCFIAGVAESDRPGAEIVPSCPRLAKAFGACELAPSRKSSTRVPIGTPAHITDAASYALIWAEGDRYKLKRGAPESGAITGIDIAKRGPRTV